MVIGLKAEQRNWIQAFYLSILVKLYFADLVGYLTFLYLALASLVDVIWLLIFCGYLVCNFLVSFVHSVTIYLT